MGGDETKAKARVLGRPGGSVRPPGNATQGWTLGCAPRRPPVRAGSSGLASAAARHLAHDLALPSGATAGACGWRGHRPGRPHPVQGSSTGPLTQTLPLPTPASFPPFFCFILLVSGQAAFFFKGEDITNV